MEPRVVEVGEASLTLPFGCLGVVGGAMLWELLAPDQGLLVARLVPLAVTFGLGGALLGFLGNRWLSRSPVQIIRVLGAAFMVVGALIGAVSGLWADGFYGGALWLLFLTTFALPFGLVTIAARRVGRARLGSRVDASDRRAVWVVTSGLLMAVAFVFQPEVARLKPDVVRPSAWALDPLGLVNFFELGFMLVGVAALAVMMRALALDVWALWRLGRQAKEIPGAVPVATGEVASLIADVDFGVGDVAVEVRSVPVHSYRDAGRSKALYRGDPGLAMGAIRQAIWLEVGIMFCITLLAVALTGASDASAAVVQACL